jgi:hypothetical protein
MGLRTDWWLTAEYKRSHAVWLSILGHLWLSLERNQGRQYVLQVVSGETIPVVKEALVELTLGQSALKIWVFVARITDELILGLYILRAYYTSVDMGLHMLRLGQEGVQVKTVRTASVLTLSRHTENRRKGRPVCWQCGRTGYLRRDCPRRPAKELVDKRDWRRVCAAGGKTTPAERWRRRHPQHLVSHSCLTKSDNSTTAMQPWRSSSKSWKQSW